MSTQKQELALNKMVENGGIASLAMIDAGYSSNTAKTPQKLTESIGFLELCEEKGLTDQLLVNALVEDIKCKTGNRKAELELAFKIKGYLQPKSVTLSLPTIQSSVNGLSQENKLEIEKALGYLNL